MRKPVKILHPTDLSPHAKVAFREAMHLAKTLNARVDLLHVAPTFGDDPLRNAFDVSIDEKQFYTSLLEEIDTKLVALQEEENAGAVETRRVHSRGTSPAEVILDYASKQDIDIIVMGTHGYRGLKKLLLGSTALEVIHGAPCDVITVNAHTDAPPPGSRKTILVPLDLSDRSKALLDEAVVLAEKLHYNLHLVHVLETTFVPAFGLNANDLYQLLPSRREAAEQRLKALLGELDTDVKIDVSLREGHPSREITQMAKETRPALIMLTPNAMNWLEHMPLGSVTEYIMAHAPAPIYVKPVLREEAAPPKTQTTDMSPIY